MLKHSGDKVHNKIHPALTEPLADARIVDLSSPGIIGLLNGGDGKSGGGVQRGERDNPDDSLPPLKWLHPAGTSDSAKGVSLVVVVDPSSMGGLKTLEQVMTFFVGGCRIHP